MAKLFLFLPALKITTPLPVVLVNSDFVPGGAAAITVRAAMDLVPI